MFLIPTGTNEAIDTCDIAFVVATGPTSCACTFVDGSTLRVNAVVDDFADEINAEYDPGMPLLVGPLVLGSQVGYFAGQQVQRVQARPGVPLESLISFQTLRSIFAMPAPVADVVNLLNATSRCGGGGAGDSGYTEHNETDDLTVTGVGSFNADPSSSCWVRTGNGSEANAGDVVSVDVFFNCNSNAGDVPIGFTIGNLPGPYDAEYGVQVSGINIYQVAGATRPEFSGARIAGSTSTSITFEGSATTGGNAAWSVGLRFTYRIAGV